MFGKISLVTADIWVFVFIYTYTHNGKRTQITIICDEHKK